jgi:hypothetical protein
MRSEHALLRLAQGRPVFDAALLRSKLGADRACWSGGTKERLQPRSFGCVTKNSRLERNAVGPLLHGVANAQRLS